MRTRRIGLASVLCGLLLAGAVRPVLGVDRIDINSATATELAELPGVGPAKAQAIVAHRETARFRSPEDIREVKGIGDVLYEKLRDRITVGEGGEKE